MDIFQGCFTSPAPLAPPASLHNMVMVYNIVLFYNIIRHILYFLGSYYISYNIICQYLFLLFGNFFTDSTFAAVQPEILCFDGCTGARPLPGLSLPPCASPACRCSKPVSKNDAIFIVPHPVLTAFHKRSNVSLGI